MTFDSGGLSLKPTDGMLTMKCDMAGAATVLGAMQAIAQLKLPVNVVGLMGLVENMTGRRRYKLGDVLTARNGRTIEVHNTDAEGRLVLADVLCVTRRNRSREDHRSGHAHRRLRRGAGDRNRRPDDQRSTLVRRCSAAAARVRRAGLATADVPRMYDEQIKSEVADIKNVGEGRWGGAITAAKFLEQFVDGKPWTHIDIAGPAFLRKAQTLARRRRQRLHGAHARGSGARMEVIRRLTRHPTLLRLDCTGRRWASNVPPSCDGALDRLLDGLQPATP